jgi:hypothetical protein
VNRTSRWLDGERLGLVIAFLGIVGLILMACLQGCRTSGEYLRADRATFEAISPEYRRYVEADPALSSEEKARRLRTVETWRLRLDKAGD